MEKWQRIPQTRRELVARLAPMYQTASRARKQLVLDEVVKTMGYARTSAIRLLNHPVLFSHFSTCLGPSHRNKTSLSMRKQTSK